MRYSVIIDNENMELQTTDKSFFISIARTNALND
jgi:hypothetical protein